ncbi:hypothetical protein D3C84_859720 [compost metagenome]
MQKNGKRSLAALQRRGDVGELRRHTAQSRRRLFGGDPGAGQRVIEACQALTGCVELRLVFVVGGQIDLAGLAVLGQGLLLLVQLTEATRDGVNLAEQALKLIRFILDGLGRLFGVLAHLFHASASLVQCRLDTQARIFQRLQRLARVRRLCFGVSAVQLNDEAGCLGHCLSPGNKNPARAGFVRQAGL